MAWTNFVGPLAITSRRRVVASAVVYGLSLTVRFTSAPAEEAEIPAQVVMANDETQIVSMASPPKFAQPTALYRGWPFRSRTCSGASESPMSISPMLSCSSQP